MDKARVDYEVEFGITPDPHSNKGEVIGIPTRRRSTIIQAGGWKVATLARVSSVEIPSAPAFGS